jgi:hypothetical protein
VHWELVDRYLAGECVPQEIVEIERWVSELPERRRLLDQLAGPGEVEITEARAMIWARIHDEVGEDPARPF